MARRVRSEKHQPIPEQQEVLARLVQAVERLESEVRFLSDSLDRMQDDFAWALQNDPRRERSWLPAPPPTHITSLPRDPLAADFGERINRVNGAELTALREQATESAEQAPKKQALSPGQLF